MFEHPVVDGYLKQTKYDKLAITHVIFICIKSELVNLMPYSKKSIHKKLFKEPFYTVFEVLNFQT